MKLQALALHNFRQFKNERIEFAVGSEKNVTVIHGSNGSGKTTLLNAFTWVMYGEVEFDTRPERLTNEGEMSGLPVGDRLRVEVKLEFEHEGENYEAVRWAEYEKTSDDDLDGQELDSELSVVYWDEEGVRHRRDNPTTALSQILPKRLSSLFFFDGEDIDELAGVDNQDRIKESIQNIMGLTILERSIDHLQKVEERFEDEMQKYGGKELGELIDKKKSLQDKIEDEKSLRQDKDQSASQLETEINDIKQKLERLSESAALEDERTSQLKRQEELEEELEEVEAEIRDLISNSGFLTFAMPAIRSTAEDLDDLRAQGLIPSELSSGFVDKLLDQGTCICGRSLEEGTEHYQEVASWKSEMSSDGIDEAAVRLIAHLERFSDQRSSFFDEVEGLVDRRRELNDKIQRTEEKIDDIGAELEEMDSPSGKDHESPADLEATRKQKAAERSDLLEEIGRIDQRIEDLQEDLDGVEKEISDAKEEKQEANLAQRRWKVAQEVRKDLEGSFKELQDTVRNWANDLIDETYSDIVHKDLSAEITDDFALKIWQDVGDQQVEIEKSMGERQIASLAFIASLVGIAKERYESADDSSYFTGGIYPIVMDSPFGALDFEHRKQVSKAVPKLGEQVIVMATDAQWEGPVEEEMSEIAGEQYWLDFAEGDGTSDYPRTRIVDEQTVAQRGD